MDSVTIDSDGRWFVAAESSNTPVPDSSDDENGDYMRIESGRPPSRSLGRSAASSGLITPASNFRDDSLPAGRPNNKRTVSQVIDLTLSDDEDYDEPMRPSKRNTAAFPTPSSFVGSDGVATNGYSSVGTPHLEYEDLRVHEVDYFGRY